MKYSFLFFLVNFLLFTNTNLYAQVTIGTDLYPEKAALLDLKTTDGGNEGGISSGSGGILFPRVKIETLDQLNVFSGISDTQINSDIQKKRHKGLTVYNIGSDAVETGIYTWNGSKWQKAGTRKEINFFYMPSIEIDLNATPPAEGIDLYEKYEQQFSHPKAGSTTDPIPTLEREDLHYYVTDYDDNIFTDVDINSDGEMTYSLQNDLPDDVCCSHINIVFVVK